MHDNLDIRQNRLLFVTSSRGTKWLSYSQRLIKRSFPFSKRVIINGTTSSWQALDFLEVIDRYDSDYVIHIDEDCFLLDPSRLSSLIDALESNPEVALAGTPDGGVPYRTHNPCACNLFFLIMRTKTMRELLNANKDWKQLRFKDVYKKFISADNYSFFNDEITYDDMESYYSLFWLIFENQHKIMYLPVKLNERYYSTDVYLQNNNKPFLRHMWCARNWSAVKKRPNDLTERERYELQEKEVLKPLLKGVCFPDLLVLSFLFKIFVVQRVLSEIKWFFNSFKSSRLSIKK